MATELDEKNAEAIYAEVKEIDKGSVPGKGLNDSFLLCKKAAQLGHIQAMRLLGNKYFYGEGVQADHKKALEWWKKAADAGSIVAMYDVGVAYKLGHGVEEDQKKSREYFQKAVDRATEQGSLDVDSTVAIAMIIDEQLVQCKEPEDSFSMFKAAAVAGHTEAMHILGYKYFYGIGVQENIKEAVKWWKKAVEAGNVPALFDMGLVYEFGYGEKVNAQKAADKGNVKAKMQLAEMYGKGELVAKDIKKAFDLTAEAAEAGDASAAFALASMYLDGVGCYPDAQKAYALYAEAAERGHYEGWYEMGFILENKLIVSSEDDYMDLYKKAADAGVASAQSRLGIEYLYGENKNTELGLRYLHDAADQDDPVAVGNLGLEYIRGEIIDKDQEKGLMMLEQASDEGAAEASYYLAELFFCEYCIPKDLEKAKKYAKLAVEQGYQDNTGTIEKIMSSESESLIEKIINWFKKL